MQDASTQTTNNGLISIDGIDREDITCLLSLDLFFDPVVAIPCGHAFERTGSQKIKNDKCPCCRENIVMFYRAFDKKNMMDKVLAAHPELYAEVCFDLDYFAKVVSKNELNTPIGERFIQLLQHAPCRLTEKAIDGTQKDKTAIEKLITTEQGRQVLREKLICVHIPELFQLKVNGKTIADWMKPEEKAPESSVNSN